MHSFVNLMYQKNIRQSKFKIYKNKHLFLVSAIAIGILCPSNVISQSLMKSRFNEVNLNSNRSFITEAVERTGSAVVTIDTQRYVKKSKLPRNSKLFLDPYF